MRRCPRCGFETALETPTCPRCGAPLGAESVERLATTPPPDPERSGPAPSGGPLPAGARPAAPIAPSGPSKGFFAALGIIGLLALFTATGFKIAAKPGRVLPPVDQKLRAAQSQAKSSEAADGTEADTAPRGTTGGAAAGQKTVAGTKASAQGKTAAGAKTGTAAGADGGAKAAGGAQQKPAQPAEPELGPPPTQSEIRACIDKRKSRIKNCANRAAENFEHVGGGTARATMNPDGRLTNISVPGGRTFSSCTIGVLRGLTCRKYKGGPIPITYEIR